MTQGWIALLGGVGLFLFGMGTVTLALADLAGPQLRRFLGRATETPLRGALTGAAAAAALQSSSAVLVMAIGFVGAGAMGFAQTIGVILGASLGSTANGWLVTLAGLKLGLGAVAMPLLPVASLAVLIGHGRVARLARLAAGLCLLFLGLDAMQGALQGGRGLISPAGLPGDSFGGRLVLVLTGAALSLLLQSSNTGLALVLALLGAGALTLGQGAALVVGLNMGAPLAGLLAAAGGNREMRMTALASVLMHQASGAVLFLSLPVAVRLLGLLPDGQVALLAWHSAFNLAMAAAFLPQARPFATLLGRIVPRAAPGELPRLDPALLTDPATALAAAAQEADLLRRQMAADLTRSLSRQEGPADQATAMAGLEDWLGRVRVAQGNPGPRLCRTELLHLTDHLSRLNARLQEGDRLAVLRADPGLARVAGVLAQAMARGGSPQRMARLERAVVARVQRLRQETFAGEAAGQLPAAQVFARTDALRWLERVADHAARTALHGDAARRALAGG